MRKKMPPSMRILPESQPDQGMLLLHEAICCQGNAAPEPAGDVQTCGICQRHFALSDVIRFIHQRVLPGSPSGAGGRDTPPADPAPNGRRRPSGSGPRRLATSVGDRQKLQLNGLSPTPSVSSTSSREEESRREREEEVRRRLVDAGANTADSEPGSYVCFTCKNSFDSAWSLVRHVQEDHGVNIYENGGAAACRPSSPSPPLRRRSPSPRRRSPSPRRRSPSPRWVSPPPRLPSPSRSAPLTALPPVARPLPPPPPPPLPLPPVSARLAPTSSAHAGFELPFLRMPLGGDKPFPSLLSAPFSRPPSHNFRMENIISEQFRMNAPLTLPPFELGPRPRPPLSLAMEPLDFYSQRLRQLAGASLPSAADLLTPPAKRARVSPPPFGSPAGPSTSTPSPGQQPVAPVRTGPPKRKERPRACEHCHKVFRFQSNLIVHRRIHTGEKPYKCKICSHACTQSSKLKRHMKTHMKELELSVEKNSQASDDTKEEDDDVSVQEEEDEELLDEDDEDSSVTDAADGPEDLSTKSTTSTPVPAPLTPNNNLPPTPSSEKSSLVGELMDKFGLSNINAYRDAYKQALRESGKEEEPLSDSNHSDDELLDSEAHDSDAHDSEARDSEARDSEARDSDGQDSEMLDSDAMDSEAPGSEAQESDAQTGETHISEAHEIARFGETRDSEARESGTRDGGALRSVARFGEARDCSQETSAAERPEWSTIKVREEFGGGLLSHQPALDLSRGSLLSLEAAFDPARRLKLELGGRDAPDPSLFPGLWLPPMAMSRDFPFPPRSAPDFLSHAKVAADGSFKVTQRPLHAPFAAKPGGRIGMHSPSPKRERSRRDTCEYCGKVFKNCSNLTVHRRSHTGEKPYHCNMCNYACAQSSKLTRHMKTHGRMGKDVYQCRFCTMPFSVASTLEKHMRKCVVSQNNKTGLLPPVLPGH